MRIAVISDIHGNMDAFQEVLADIEAMGIGTIFSLGDNIGYGAESDRVLACIQDMKIPSVLGNHELGLVQPRYLEWFNPQARKSLVKTIDMLSDRSIRYIYTLKRYLVHGDSRFVHGFPPKSPTLYQFQIRDDRVRQIMAELPQSICFTGHTHLLDLLTYDGKAVYRRGLGEGKEQLVPANRHIVNCGAVGQPRDGNNRAKYVIWDSDLNLLEVRFITYDIAAAAEKIRAAGFPASHADRLW